MADQETVVVLGASPKEERYSFKAMRMLREHGFTVIPVNPAQTVIQGVPVAKTLADIHEAIDTVTVYVNPAEAERQMQCIADLAPRRVILNPGTESEALRSYLSSRDIEVIEGCTLVMLGTGQF